MSEVTPLPKPKKKRKKATITDQADALFGKLIRSPGFCVTCGSTDTIQCAHGFSRSYRSVRWDFRNAFAQCRSCHFHFTNHPLEWDDWLRDKWGADLYAEMKALALSYRKVDMPALIADLKERVARMEKAA